MGSCKHEYYPMPASDRENELPLICWNCQDSVLWGDGTVMTREEWNLYYTSRGELVDPDNNPSWHNPDYTGADPL